MTTTTTTDDSSSSSSLAPDVDTTTDTLTTAYNANNTITGYCHTLLNTSLTWNTATQGVEPGWFTSLADSLTVAQGHANIWLVGTPATTTTAAVEALGAAIFSTVPQTIINYGNTFTSATNDILTILNSIPDGENPTTAQQNEINELLGALITELQAQQTTLSSVQTQLTTFAEDVQDDYNSFETGQDNAQEAVELLDEDIETINSQIALVTTELQKDSAAATASEIGMGVGIFVVVAACALAVATDGATLPLVVAGVAVLSTGAAITTTVIFSSKVNDDLQKLYSLQNELSDDQRQVSALTGLTTTLTSLIDGNTSAQTAISDTMDMWSTLESKLQSVLDDLEDAEADETVTILEELDIQDAQTAWAQLVSYATYMQTGSITVSTTSQPDMQITTTTGTTAVSSS